MDSRALGRRPRVLALKGKEGSRPSPPDTPEDEGIANPPTGIAYLVIFALVAVVTALAFIPVWLLVQAQRVIRLLADLINPRM